MDIIDMCGGEGCRSLTDAQTVIDALRSEVARLTAERDRLAEREALFIKALSPVCDAGQYRADIVSAIRRVTAERDALRAEVEAMRDVEAAARREMWQSMNLPIRQAIERIDALRARKAGG